MTMRKEEITTPEGDLVLQTVAMPADTNAYGDIFGGWLVSQMDLGGAVMAHLRAKNRVTTVAIDRMVFLRPVYIGDLVCCYASVIKTGHSSITVKIQVWAKRMRHGIFEQVTEGTFTFVALSEDGRPKEIDWESDQSTDPL
jgi:acyl-CoA thioesterase YciA